MRVLVSDWARKAARELDDSRDAWLSRRATTTFVEAELQDIQLDSSIDHLAALSGDYRSVLALKQRANHDVSLLSGYLSKLNASKTIGGKRYPKNVFYEHRARIINELLYKQLLAGIAKEAARLERMRISDPPPVPEQLEGLNDIDILAQYDRVFRDAMRQLVGGNWFSLLSDEDQQLIEFVERHLRTFRSKN